MAYRTQEVVKWKDCEARKVKDNMFEIWLCVLLKLKCKDELNLINYGSQISEHSLWRG